MTSPLAEDYLRWLAPQVRDMQAQETTYYELLQILFEKEFIWLIPNDDNRMADGCDLRVEFCRAHDMHPGALNEIGPCSFLEALIGLSRRLAFAAGGEPIGWAWTLLTNLELDKMPDRLSHRKKQKVNDILDRCIWRNYSPDGQGGFFPLAWPDEDQTKVELWYQMAAYIDELHPEHHR